ncbi:MAG: DinB family protein, partial [Gemmatimonadota bacterium]
GLQGQSADLRDDLLGHFGRSSRKMEQLSQAVPAELYTWSPGEGVMSIARVYMHIARYNYMYLEENLGIAAPAGVDWPNFESITDKESVVELLAQSIEHVKQSVGSMSEADLTRETTLYGRQVAGWAVLVQLVAHMNEHVGQSIAYARMNGIVPPWSR